MSHLPTPPHTLARPSTFHNLFDKENVPPASSKAPSSPISNRKSVFPLSPKSSPQAQSKLQLRVPRVVFSQINRHHPYAHQPRALPSSRMSKPPNKSILKSTSSVFSTAPPATATRDPTPEPEKPLETAEFLVTPIERLLSSLETDVDGQVIPVSQHDLTEAYVTLGARLRTHFKVPADGSIPALAPLKENEEQLARIFVRDLTRASQEPPVLTSSDEESLFDTEASSSDTETPKKRGVTAEQITYARDAFILTQSSIRTIAVILSTKAIYSVFSEVSLTCITSALLSILLAPKLYLPNARKTTMLAMWAVQNIRLPTSVVAPLADRFLEAVQRGIDGQLGKEGKKGAGCEALNAIHTLCRLYPAVFIPHMAALLTAILHRCVPANQPATSANSNNICLRASAALGGIALGVLNWARVEQHDPDLKEAQAALAECVVAFFAEPATNGSSPSKMSARKQQKSPRRLPASTEAAAAPLIDAIVYAISANGDEGADATSSPAWAISLLAALGVLFRESLFSSPLGVGLFLECLSKAGSKDAKGQSKLLLRMWWPSLVWAAGMLDQVEESRLLSLSQAEQKSQGRKSVWSQSIWHLKFMGVATLTTLLNDDPESDEDREARIRVSMAWLRYAIKDNQAPAIHLLSQLVHTESVREGERNDWHPDVVLARQLFDGAIVSHDWKTLSAFVKDVLDNKMPAMVLDGELGDDEALYGLPTVEDLRPLTGAEVRVWFEPMVQAWKDIVGRVSFGRAPAGEDGILGKAPTVVFTIWERLLHTQADFVQDPESDPSVVASVVDLITSVLTSFVVPHNDYPRSMEGSEQDRSLAALVFARRLWDICKETFGSFPANSALEAIPTSVVNALRNPQDIQIHEFGSDPVAAKLFEHWTNFLVDVLVAGPLNTLHRVCDDLMWEDDASRVLWSILAKNFTSQEEWEGWHVADGTCLLGVPFSEVCDDPISMDLTAMEIWEGLLDRVMEKAIADHSDPDAVLMSAAEMLNNCGGIDNATSLRVMAAIIRRVEFPQYASSYTPPAGKIEPEFDPQVLGSEINFILAVVNTVLTRVTPSELNTMQEIDAGIMLLNHLHPLLNRMPAAVSVIVIAALQDGFSAWLKPSTGSDFAEDAYNDKIVTLYITGLAAIQNAAPSVRVLHALQHFFASVFENPPAPAKGPLGFQRFWMDNYQNFDAAALQPYPEVLKPVLRSLVNVSPAIGAPGLSFGSDPSSLSSLPIAPVFEDNSQHAEPAADDSGYIADESNLAPGAPIFLTAEDTFDVPEARADVDGEALALPFATLIQASPERRSTAIDVPPSPSLAQLLERAASERATPLASAEVSVSDSASDAGASETEVSEAPAPKALVDYESTGSQNPPVEDAAFDQFVDFSKEQENEPVVRPMEPSSEIDAAAILDRGFVVDVEENGGSSSEEAPSSDDASASIDDSTSSAQANNRPASPLPRVAEPTVLVTATPALGSDDIEIPDSQADTTDTDTDEEDEADARFVDCSLELICPPTPDNRERFGAGPSSSKGSLKRPVASLLPLPHKRARLHEQVSSPVEDEDVSVPVQPLLEQITKSLPFDSPSVHSPTPHTLPSQQVLAAATPSPLNTSFSPRKRFFLEAVEVPSLASLKRRWQRSASNPKPTSSRTQTLRVSNDVFGDGQSSANSPVRPSLQKASSLLGNALPSLFGAHLPQRSISFAGNSTHPLTPVFEQEIRSDDTEACVTAARQILESSGPSSDDVPSSFEGVIGSSGLKRQRSADDRQDEDENDTPTRRRLSRTVSVPVPKHVESTSSRTFLRTHSLSAEVQRSLEQVVGSPGQLSITDLKSLSVVLSSFQEELNAAIEQKSKDGEHGL
ncbi:hypothetical protein M407DRAFT_21049 [Tulasnella calospora MUT 4182]|uniref:Telomere-associated protein Rif1 N-terminal domain-containing protein n=1 Tax=Tulasnella calospora MUT 4182 TaxID=1051891 RepID=A0A0C3QQH4_9AGAM|nr:hypothetical protein M407DRAFT_21049 [Tulasnella calospora MUT 4182]